MLPDLKKHYPWLGDVASVPIQQSLRHLERAFEHFFEGRAKYPTFKKKQHSQSATYAANAFTWDGGMLTLAKMHTPLDIYFHRDLPVNCRPSSVTVSKDCANRYFVSLLVEEDIKPLPDVDKRVGLDLGLTSMVILATGEAVANPKFYAKDEKCLAKAQRQHAKKKKSSRNRNKARVKVARVHARINDRRRDYQNKLSTRIVHENQVICAESLAVKNMVKIDQWYPSSKTCSACKHVLDSLPLDRREWVCPQCGVVHDRDTNAAVNILAEGHAARCLWREWKTRSGESSSGNPH